MFHLFKEAPSMLNPKPSTISPATPVTVCPCPRPHRCNVWVLTPEGGLGIANFLV